MPFNPFDLTIQLYSVLNFRQFNNKSSSVGVGPWYTLRLVLLAGTNFSVLQIHELAGNNFSDFIWFVTKYIHV